MTSFSSGLVPSVLVRTLDLIMLVTSRFTMFSHGLLSALCLMDVFVHYEVMVFVGGISDTKGAVGCTAKAK